MAKHRILIVDDDAHIREVIRFAMDRAGFRTEEAENGAVALTRCQTENPPDLVILDILMPELEGTEVCRRLRTTRSKSAQIPIVFLSSKDDEVDRIVGLELGGDDYLTKPFSPRELVARVRAVLRRTVSRDHSTASSREDQVLRRGNLTLDLERFEVTYDHRPIVLTVTEFGILRTLMRRRGKVYTREELMTGAYRDHNIVTDRTINSHVKRLRRKLAGVGAQPIETVHGLGYRLGA